MKKTNFKRILSLLLCVLMLAAAFVFTTGCGDKKDDSSSKVAGADISSAAVKEEITELGQGKLSFSFKATMPDGTQKSYAIKTDKETVGAALIEQNLIAGEDGPYGLYVKTVCGVTVDYDKDGKYWAFYENGAMAPKGVDTTDIVEGALYEFKAE